MKLIVGLGNPGLFYASSRHNIGFQVVKGLAKSEKIVLKKEKGISALSGKGKICNEDILLVLPLTFMNLSGNAVKPILKKYKIDLDNVLVICDDLDLGFGRVKIRSLGSSAGHRGIQSLIDSLGTNKFARLRIGIGRPGEKQDTAKFVLSRFNSIEKKKFLEITSKAEDCVRIWVEKGIDSSMNIFNRKDKE